MKRMLMVAMALFVSFFACAASDPALYIGDQTFYASNGSKDYSQYGARVSYTGSGFRIAFYSDAIVYSDREAAIESSKDVTVVLGTGVTVLVNGFNAGILSTGGDVVVMGGGTLNVRTREVWLLRNNVGIGAHGDVLITLGATVNVGAHDTLYFLGANCIEASGKIKIEAAMANLCCERSLLVGYGGVVITASLVNLMQGAKDSDSSTAVYSNGGDISIVGSVVSLVGKGVGIASAGSLTIGQSCVGIVSRGIALSGGAGDVKFADSRIMAVSSLDSAVSLSGSGASYPTPLLYEDAEGNRFPETVFIGDGEYRFGTITNKTCIMGGVNIEIDGGHVECCSPWGVGAYARDFALKDGSLKMVDMMDFRECYQNIMAEAVVLSTVGSSGVFENGYGLKSTLFTSMIEQFLLTELTNPKGSADYAVIADIYRQYGGEVVQGSSKYGYLATKDGTIRNEIGTVSIPALNGGTCNALLGARGWYNGNYYDYYELHPTNALGKKLTHVAYSPYWVYVKQKITVTFDPNGGTVSPLSRTCTEDSAYGTLPTPARAGAEFVGWYDGTKKVLKSTVIEQGRGDHVLVARWELRPDLVVTASLSPSVITKSETTKITYTVKNVGLAAADASSVEILVGNASWRRSVSALVAGASYSETVTLNGSIFAAGTFTVKVTTDIGAKVTESDETNNEVSLGTLSVVRNPVNSNYDLQYKKRASSDPSEAWLSSSLTGTKAETTFKLGAPIYIQLGFWNAKQVRISGWIYVRADLVKSTGSSIGYYTWSWQGLNKNATGYLTDTYRNPAMLQNLKEGSYALTLTLDSNDYYSETDEANNIRQINFSVYDPTPKPTTYTIEFKANGGSGTMTSMTCSPDCVYGLSKSCFAKTNKRFAGWACSNGNRYDDGVLVFNLAESGETVTMTAIWE